MRGRRRWSRVQDAGQGGTGRSGSEVRLLGEIGTPVTTVWGTWGNNWPFHIDSLVKIGL